MPRRRVRAVRLGLGGPRRIDLVISTNFPKGVEATLATLDGKNPSAIDHPLVRELSKPEGTFHPVYIGFIDVAVAPNSHSMTTFSAVRTNPVSIGSMRVGTSTTTHW